jgi:formate hydrogenlyase subunit 6/NADH:ubiquinone oxidoreductase subunit I
MLSSIKGMVITFISTLKGFRQPVTRQYPTTPTPVQPRFMGFPALTWDDKVVEPFCTGCMVCIRNCPTQCMSATMKDNPLQKEGKSHRRKIVDEFEINLNRCILCGICVEVCNFDAIVMSHEHEKSVLQRNGDRVDLPALLEMGKKYQRETDWVPPTVLEKRRKEAEEAAKAKAEATAIAQAGASKE